MTSQTVSTVHTRTVPQAHMISRDSGRTATRRPQTIFWGMPCTNTKKSEKGTSKMTEGDKNASMKPTKATGQSKAKDSEKSTPATTPTKGKTGANTTDGTTRCVRKTSDRLCRTCKYSVLAGQGSRKVMCYYVVIKQELRVPWGSGTGWCDKYEKGTRKKGFT